MYTRHRHFFSILISLLLAACGGSGGNDSDDGTGSGGNGGPGGGPGGGSPAPTLSFSATPNSDEAPLQATLIWTSTNAQDCSAAGSWSGARATSGTETLTITAPGTHTFELSCSGAGGQILRQAIVSAIDPLATAQSEFDRLRELEARAAQTTP